MIEEVLEALGMDPEGSRLSTQSRDPVWRVQKGSAHVYILLHQRGDENYLRVTAPIMHIEGRVDEARLYRRLLELNDIDVVGAAFGIDARTVMLTTERTTTGLDHAEVRGLMQRLQAYADRFDHELPNEFGGRPARPPVT
jgi:hypothetical protein